MQAMDRIGFTMGDGRVGKGGKGQKRKGKGSKRVFTARADAKVGAVVPFTWHEVSYTSARERTGHTHFYSLTANRRPTMALIAKEPPSEYSFSARIFAPAHSQFTA